MNSYYHDRDYTGKRALKDFFQIISMTEMVSLLLFITMVAAFIFISIWSGVLLITGNTQGGGPLGMIANVIIGIFN